MKGSTALDAIESLRKVRDLRQKFLIKFMERQGLLAIKEIRLRTPVDYGQLRNRFELKGPFADPTAGVIVMSIVNPQIYGPYIESGHRKRKKTVAGLLDGGESKQVGLMANAPKNQVGLIKRDADTDSFVGGYHMVRDGIDEIRKTFEDDFVKASDYFWVKYGN